MAEHLFSGVAFLAVPDSGSFCATIRQAARFANSIDYELDVLTSWKYPELVKQESPTEFSMFYLTGNLRALARQKATQLVEASFEGIFPSWVRIKVLDEVCPQCWIEGLHDSKLITLDRPHPELKSSPLGSTSCAKHAICSAFALVSLERSERDSLSPDDPSFRIWSFGHSDAYIERSLHQAERELEGAR